MSSTSNPADRFGRVNKFKEDKDKLDAHLTCTVSRETVIKVREKAKELNMSVNQYLRKVLTEIA